MSARKDKKARIMQRNKRHNLINLMAQEHEATAERGGLSAPEYDPEKSREHAREERKREEEMLWTGRAGIVRNRLTQKKRVTADRWNRFAGTKGGGGRGR